MPLQTRDWVSLAQLSAGVKPHRGNPSGDSGESDSAYFSVDGVNLWQNDFRLDGINDNIEVYGGSSVGNNAAIVPPPDAIEEFKLQNEISTRNSDIPLVPSSMLSSNPAPIIPRRCLGVLEE